MADEIALNLRKSYRNVLNFQLFLRDTINFIDNELEEYEYAFNTWQPIYYENAPGKMAHFNKSAWQYTPLYQAEVLWLKGKKFNTPNSSVVIFESTVDTAVNALFLDGSDDHDPSELHDVSASKSVFVMRYLSIPKKGKPFTDDEYGLTWMGAIAKHFKIDIKDIDAHTMELGKKYEIEKGGNMYGHYAKEITSVNSKEQLKDFISMLDLKA